MNTKTKIPEANMKQAQTNQADGQEAPDSSSRPAKFTSTEARFAAMQIGGLATYKLKTARMIQNALDTFGGRVIAVQTTRAAARS